MENSKYPNIERLHNLFIPNKAMEQTLQEIAERRGVANLREKWTPDRIQQLYDRYKVLFPDLATEIKAMAAERGITLTDQEETK